MSDEFDVNLDLGLGDDGDDVQSEPEVVAAEPEKKAAPKKRTAKKKPQTEPKEVDEKLDATSDPNKGKVRIVIDQVKGMSNYEVVGVNGKIYQIKRGEPVWVPEAVAHVLDNAVMTDTIIDRHPITGERVERTHTYSAIPWRRV